MALELNPASSAQDAVQKFEQQSADAPSVAIAPASTAPMVGQTPGVSPLPAPGQVVKNAATNTVGALKVAAASPQPGNWSKAVLGSVLHAMAGMGAPGGVIDTLGTMAGSRPGQEYNDVQAARAARQVAAQKAQEFDLTQHVNYARLATQEKLLSNASDEANQKAIAQSQDDATQFQMNGGRLIKGGLAPNELTPYFGQKTKDGRSLSIIMTGEKVVGVNPDGSPKKQKTYSVFDPGPGIKITQPNIDYLAKHGLLPDNTTPGQPIDARTYQTLMGQARAADLVQAKLNDTLTKYDVDLGKEQDEAQKGFDAKAKTEASEFFGTVQSQLGLHSTPLDVYRTIRMETQQVDPKTNQPTPTAVKARLMLPGVTAMFGGPAGIQKLVDSEMKKATAGVKLTPAQEELKTRVKQTQSLRDSALKALQAAQIAQKKDPAISNDVVTQAQQNFDGADKNWHDSLGNFDRSIGEHVSAQASSAPAPAQVPMIRMKLPNGQTGSIPQSQVPAFLKQHPNASQVQ